MSNKYLNSSLISSLTANSPLLRFAPQPNGGSSFSSFLGKAGDLVGGALSAAGGGLPTEYLQLLNRQAEIQEQMMRVSLISNIEKSRHETQMAAIRNMRVA